MAKRAGLPWDCIISTELFGTYKPDPATYLGAARLLGLDPARGDAGGRPPGATSGPLRPSDCGRRTCPGPTSGVPGAAPPEPPDPDTDVVAADFVALAAELGSLRSPDGHRCVAVPMTGAH